MKDFELVFEKDKNSSFTIHSSYFFEIQKQLQEEIKKELIKQGHTKEKYIFKIFIRQLEYIPYQSSFMLSALRYNKIHADWIWFGSIDVSAWDKEWGNQKNSQYLPDRKLNIEKDISDGSISFSINRCTIFPSETKMKEQNEKAVERYIQKLSEKMSCPFEIACEWPDVILEIYYETNPTKAEYDKLERLLATFINTWNKNQEKRKGENFIHFYALIENDKSDNKIQYHIDFGNCEPLKMVSKILIYLNDNLENIQKIVLE